MVPRCAFLSLALLMSIYMVTSAKEEDLKPKTDETVVEAVKADEPATVLSAVGQNKIDLNAATSKVSTATTTGPGLLKMPSYLSQVCQHPRFI